MIVAAGLFLAAAKQDKTENILPCVFLAVIAVLYPFYCMDLLKVGRLVVYGLIAAAIVGSGVWIITRHRCLTEELRRVISPGVVLFLALSLFVWAYTRNNLVGLWDELRLWGAVPKAMYMTERLQLGEEALIFRIMQSYPPGMPLLVYFMTALSPEFCEGHIFAVYGMLYFALLLPAFQNLTWKHWRLFLPLLVLTICLPCVLTSHGGDFDWFYESLFIDPILGVMAGYTFFLAGTRPFASRFSGLRFSLALLTLTIIKDSGAMFALVAGLFAVAAFWLEDRQNRRLPAFLMSAVQAFVPVALGYFLWKSTLLRHGVSTNLDNYMKRLPPLSSLLALVKQLRSQPMVVLQDPIFLNELTLTYIPCFLLLAALSYWLLRRADQRTRINMAVTWLGVCVSVGVFFLGYIISYHNAVPSFQRYAGSTLTCMLVFTLLQSQFLPLPEKTGAKMGKRRIAAAALALLTVYAGIFLVRWRDQKWNIDYALKHSVPAVSTILNTVEGDPAEPEYVYLLISETPASFSMAHHRTYYELLGTAACVRNYWNNTNVVGGDKTPETWTAEELDTIAEKWQAQLRSDGYDYLYLMTLNDFTLAVLDRFGVPDAQVGDIFAIEFQGESMLFTRK